MPGDPEPEDILEPQLPDLPESVEATGEPDVAPSSPAMTPPQRDASPRAGFGVIRGLDQFSFYRTLWLSVAALLLGLGVWWAAVSASHVSPKPPSVVLMCSPPAQVYSRDGTHLGKTPMTFTPGSVHGPVVLKRPGYQDRQVQMVVSPHSPPAQRVTLSPALASVSLAGLRGGAMVSVDGAPAVDVKQASMAISPGKHRLTVLLPDHAPVPLSITAQPGRSVAVAAMVARVLAARPSLTIKVKGPTHYQVAVWKKGGKKIVRKVTGSLDLKLDDQGLYSVQVKAAKYQTAQKTVDVKGPTTLTLALNRSKPKSKQKAAQRSLRPRRRVYYRRRYYAPRRTQHGGHRISAPAF